LPVNIVLVTWAEAFGRTSHPAKRSNADSD
jgi:hypothetical protein